ncbi:MAG TPA: YoaK family protein [Steroidobacteraceae bacterium]|nr:YoaK family protein [Steroidobacteraceae bacterium]
MKPEHSPLVLAIALTAVAGCVDAIGYLRLRHFFVSFMSGDSTQLAVSTVRGDWGHAGTAAAIVGLFVIGVVAGRSLTSSLDAWGRPAVLMSEALLLCLAVVMGTSTVIAISLTTFAMGVQNAAIDKEQAARIGLSYVTGTLVSLGDKLADALRADRTDRWAWVPHLLHWGALVLGAACGAFGYQAWGFWALLVPAIAAAAVAGITVTMHA